MKERILAKQCDEGDFGPDEEGLAFFKKMTRLGKSMICPDFAEANFQLQGKDGDEVVKYIQFEVQKCATPPDQEDTCGTPEEIESWLSSSSIETWSIQKKVDMSKYSSEPTYRVMKIMDKRLLGIDFIDATSLSLRQVVADSEVSWFALGYGPPSYSTTFYNGDTLLSLPINRKNGTDT